MTGGQIMFVTLGGVVGGLFSAVGLRELAVILRLQASGVRTEAIVAGHQKSESYDRDTRSTTTYYHPILEFTDREGRPQRVVMEEGGSSIEYAESYPVQIIYTPGDPPAVRIASAGRLWLGALVPLILGLGILAVAVAIWILDIPVKMG
jgi:hypothetical protein